MKIYSKLSLIAFGIAIISSAMTIMATSVLQDNQIDCHADISADANSADKGFIRTSNVTSSNPDFTQAAGNTINSVVSIKSFVTPRQRQSGGGYFDPFEYFFGFGGGGNPQRQQPQQQQQQQPQPQKPQQSGLGSGVIISTDGYIVTNNHVVKGADKLEITLNDNRTFNAKIVGADATTDLALLKIEATNLQAITFGDSDNLKVGEWVLAVGNPFGFTSTVTAGIVSAKGRSLSSATQGRSLGIESFIQTDAAVNPGNSGGALVNNAGLLVGINTAIYSQTGNYAGYSFAIPSSIVKKIITDIKQYGTVQRAVLGIAFSELTSEIAKEKGITAVNEGIYVGKVTDRSAAMDAGIKEGDVITKIDNVTLKNSGTMQEQMSRYRPGDKITITYIRANNTHSTSVTLRNNQGDTSITKADDFMSLGCAFKPLTAERKSELRISHGIEVIGVKDGKFKSVGVRDGFIILSINDTPVSSREDVEQIYKSIMESNQPDKVLFIIGLQPTGKKVYFAVDLSE